MQLCNSSFPEIQKSNIAESVRKEFENQSNQNIYNLLSGEPNVSNPSLYTGHSARKQKISI